uniref:Ig-like domain-containing protein n=1 Tax=Caenorhabditis tropicalis TaxID=1561998 RepID=A0A1I7TYF6_9PELO
MRFHEERIFQLLLYFSILLHSTVSDVVFTVEDSDTNVTTPSRHLHKLRHSRGSTPYITASSSVINPRESNRLESFSLNCPHVVDSSNKNVHIEVVWTLNETVWLKIENGHQRVVNGESTFNKRRVSGKTVMRLLLNNARYLFDYDELTGDFSMEISPVVWSSDCGAWQCHVTVRQPNGKSHTLTSRRRIKPGEIGARKETREETTSRAESKGQQEIEYATLTKESPIQVQKRGDRSSDHWHHNVASFSRNSDDNVYMTRKEEELSSNVVFARNDGPIRQHHKPVRHRELERLFDAQIDYELDMSTDDMYFLNSRARARSAQYYYNQGTQLSTYLNTAFFFSFVFLFL